MHTCPIFAGLVTITIQCLYNKIYGASVHSDCYVADLFSNKKSGAVVSGLKLNDCDDIKTAVARLFIAKKIFA